MIRTMALLLLMSLGASAAMKVLVTVVEQKSGRPVENLKAEDFTVLEDKTVRRVEAAEFSAKPIDVMMVVDTSLVGGMVQQVASSLIGQLKEKEQMALVSYDSSAELLQDFTESRQALAAALQQSEAGEFATRAGRAVCCDGRRVPTCHLPARDSAGDLGRGSRRARA